MGRNQTKNAPATNNIAIPIVSIGISATKPKLKAKRINIAKKIFIVVSFYLL